jgi:hypothetical protein
MSEFASAQTGEIGLRAIGAGAADAEAVLVIDPLHDEAGMQRVPRRALVGMNRGAYSDPLADRRHGIRLGRKHLRQRAAAALAHRHHHLTLARPVLGEPPVDPVDRQVLRPDMAAEIGAVDLGRASLAADTHCFRAVRHSLAQFMGQNEGGFVLHVEITSEGQHASAFHLVTEYRDRHQVRPERQLVPGEQRARCHREIGITCLAAPTGLTGRAAAIITDLAAAIRADRLAVGLRPAQAQEHVFGAPVGHPHHLGRTERTCWRES